MHDLFFLRGGAGVLIAILWLILVKDSPFLTDSITDAELSLYTTNGYTSHSSKTVSWNCI